MLRGYHVHFSLQRQALSSTSCVDAGASSLNVQNSRTCSPGIVQTNERFQPWTTMERLDLQGLATILCRIRHAPYEPAMNQFKQIDSLGVTMLQAHKTGDSFEIMMSPRVDKLLFLNLRSSGAQNGFIAFQSVALLFCFLL